MSLHQQVKRDMAYYTFENQVKRLEAALVAGEIPVEDIEDAMVAIKGSPNGSGWRPFYAVSAVVGTLIYDNDKLHAAGTKEYVLAVGRIIQQVNGFWQDGQNETLAKGC